MFAGVLSNTQILVSTETETEEEMKYGENLCQVKIKSNKKGGTRKTFIQREKTANNYFSYRTFTAEKSLLC